MFKNCEGVNRIPEKIRNVLTSYLNWLLNEFNGKLKLVILYGSYARGDYREDSDIDVLIVLDDMYDLPMRDRIYRLLQVIDDYYIEPHPYTPNEFLELVRSCRLTAYDALTQGMVLYKDDEYYNTVINEFKKAISEKANREKEKSQSQALLPAMEVEFKTKDGSTNWFEVSLIFPPDQTETSWEILGVARDICERKSEEQ